MAVPKFEQAKDPDDLSDWTFLFTEAMSADDTIQGIDAVSILPIDPGDVPPADGADLVSVTTMFGTQDATVWLKGGRPGWRYEVAVLLHTNGGRTLRRRATVMVKAL